LKQLSFEDEPSEFRKVFSLGITKKDGTKIPAGKIKRPELETMQYFVKGIVNKFPTQ